MDAAQQDSIETTKGGKWTALAPALATAAIFAVSFVLLRTYSYVHWHLAFPISPDDPSCDHGGALRALNGLEVYRLLFIPAGLTAYLAIRGRPRWLGVVSIVLACLVLGMAGLIQ